MGDADAKSALLIPVPEVEPHVATWRERLDPASRRGIPAHVTVLFPFVPPAILDPRVLESLAALVSTIEPFDYNFFSTAWFDNRVLYLAPEPDDGFRRVTKMLESAFPRYRSYEGKYDEPVPHLTIGDGAPPEQLRLAEEALRPSLPIVATAEEMWLMSGGVEPRSWTILERFEFRSVN